MKFQSLVVQTISLMLLFITSVAGIKYILSNWKINKLAKKIERLTKNKIDRNKFDCLIQEFVRKREFKKDAKNIIEGTDSNLQNLVRKFGDLDYRLDMINDTLKRFENYKE
ncbi:MAG: hypothetical protein ACFFBH_03915 [Promethearchaeota archaeon]